MLPIRSKRIGYRYKLSFYHFTFSTEHNHLRIIFILIRCVCISGIEVNGAKENEKAQILFAAVCTFFMKCIRSFFLIPYPTLSHSFRGFCFVHFIRNFSCSYNSLSFIFIVLIFFFFFSFSSSTIFVFCYSTLNFHRFYRYFFWFLFDDRLFI